jgi:hypothetical protein
MLNSESRGIEDARFVRFTDDDGSEKCLQLNRMVIVFKQTFLQKTFLSSCMLWSWIKI